MQDQAGVYSLLRKQPFAIHAAECKHYWARPSSESYKTKKQGRGKRRLSLEEIERARTYAERGHSLSATARMLGLYPQQLTVLFKDAGIDDISFVNGYRAAATASWSGTGALRKKHLRSAFGVTGTLSELKDHFGCKLALTSLQKRLQRGMTIEEALTTEPRGQRSGHIASDGGSKAFITHKEEIIERAKGYAMRGHSFSFAAQLLGMTNKKLRRLIEEEGADIQFVRGTDSLAFRKRLADLHESQRGKPNKNQASLAALARAREQRGIRHTAFGVTGILRELKEHFDCELSIQALRDRLKSGMSIEDALTKAPHRAPRGVYPPQFYEWLIKRRTMASAEIMAIVRSRLSPTMLQFQEPDHDIVITSRSAAHITVDVRNHSSGEVLHRLGFLKSFSSGVLFVFNPIKQNHIRFIAFEPDCSALIQKLESGGHQEAVC